jgi:diphthine synthase
MGLGLNERSLTRESFEILSRCKRIYLENYTVDFPYTTYQLEEIVGKKIIEANREKVESLEIVDEAKKMDVALLIYGSPLMATTHISLIQEAKYLGIKCKVLYNASIFDAIGETGLQLYKFGKVTSMPAWKKSFRPTSFMEIIKENFSINAHSLILADIGLEFSDALKQLKEASEEHNFKIKKLIVCQTLGTKNSKIFYRSIKEFEEFTGVRKPYCIIIPSEKLHEVEREFLKLFE